MRDDLQIANRSSNPRESVVLSIELSGLQVIAYPTFCFNYVATLYNEKWGEFTCEGLRAAQVAGLKQGDVVSCYRTKMRYLPENYVFYSYKLLSQDPRIEELKRNFVAEQKAKQKLLKQEKTK